MQYFFILGKHPQLSIAEIAAALRREKIAAKMPWASSEALVVDTAARIGPDFFYGLGGSVKFGEIVTATQIDIDVLKKKLSALLRDPSTSLRSVRDDKKRKFTFGISAYPLENGVKTGALRREMARAGIEIKKDLKERGPVRFVTSRESTLSSVVVQTNHATELVVLQGKESVLVGQTRAVQEFADLSFRDYGRPGRSAKSGMLPPKLARIMINLSECPRDKVLLDPFCGSGTVVTEAMLLGYQNITGSDLDSEAIRATTDNVTWVRSKYPEATIHAKVAVFESPVEVIAARLPHGSVQAIVTEPTLGPPRTGRETRIELGARARELASIYSSALSEFRKILAPQGRVVMVIPIFIAKPEPIRIDLKQISAQNGLRLSSSITYQRPGQWVAREITVFDKI